MKIQADEKPEYEEQKAPKSLLKYKQAPARLTDFEFLEEIGDGSFGRVFRAHKDGWQNPIAVKVMKKIYL